ncbi:MAG: SDR family oxidoreductase [Cyanobacteria bacterium J06648_1]
MSNSVQLIPAVTASLESSDQLLTLSAKSSTALQELAQSYHKFLTDSPASLADICFTTNTKRSHFKHRLAIAAQSLPQAQEKLQSFLNSSSAPGVITGEVSLQNKSSGTVFLFTGQGSQYPHMGRALYDTQPTFRRVLDRCDEILQPLLDRSLLSVLYPDSPDSPELHQTAYTQPALFALEYALAQLWQSWGIVPDAVMGHSVGEYTAAAVAGVFSLEDGLKLIAKRASLIQSLPQNGMMAAVFASEDAIAQTITAQKVEVDIATVNGAANVVISGLKEPVQKILAVFQSQGIIAKPLQVSHAFHSSLMQPILASFTEAAETMTYSSPRLPMISNLTGQLWEAGEVPNAAYWCDHLRGAVRFSTGMDTLYQQGYRTFIEMGPSSTLLYMGQKCLTVAKGLWLPSLKRGQNNTSAILESLGKLYVEGREIDWSALNNHEERRPVRLPNYPFQRQRFQLKTTSNPVPSPAIAETATAKTTDDLELFHQWRWYCETPPSPQQLATGKILIFGDRQALDSRVEEAFNRQSEQFLWVMPGDTFQQQANQFILNPNLAQDYEQLISTIKAEGHSLAGIIHDWNSRHINVDPVDISDRVLAESAYSVMFLGQALLKHLAAEIPLLLTTYSAYAVTDNPLQGVYQCLGATFNQILNQENPNLKTKVVDVMPTEVSPAQLTQLWVNELQTEPQGERIVAIRGQQRFVRGLEPIQSLTPQSGDRLPQNDDTYLITGGTSDVALELIKSLLVRVRLNLVLTGRQPLPPQAEWAQCLESKHPLSKRIRAIQELEKLGATVMYEVVDVTNRASMEGLMAKIEQRFPRLDGVIHAAGIFDHYTVKLAQKQPHSVAQVLAPKVQGTIILDEITRSQPLKFFALISSTSASKQEWGESSGDYAAANAFLDHYAIYRDRQPSPGRSLAVNFSLWRNLGIAKGLGKIGGEALILMAKSRGHNPLTPQQGANAFWQALFSNSPSVTHIINLLKIPDTAKAEPLTEMETSSQAEVPRLNLKLALEKTLCQHITVEPENLDGDRTFPELGLDSLNALEFVQQLNQVLDTQLSVTLLFEYQTPNELLDYLEKITTSPAVKVQKQRATPTPAVPQSAAKIQDIAIIGMACKVPGANDLNEYWDLLKAERSAISDVPSSRWSSQDYFDETGKAADRTYCQQGGFIDNPFEFDPLFFGISPREAKVMDPQQRLFLEIAWQAMQQSGYGGKHRPQDISVFVGCGQNNYVEHFVNSQSYGALRRRLDTSTWFEQLDCQARSSLLGMLSEVLKPSEILSETAAGNELNEIAARVSHSLDLTGASLAVNTACSSSLVALHLACENLRSGQSSMSIVGGVNLNLSPTSLTFLSRVQALSPTATCYPFDERANGMIIGEGAGALVLKPLERAVADGDYIHAVIKGSAINNDGHSQGMTAPKPQGQAAAVRQAYAQSGIDPNTVSYIEAHGTGTLLGDPIEIAGMTQAFRSYTEASQFCAVGSVKSSIGHCLSASGIISLIKVVLSMQHGMIPGTKGFKNPNPQIDFTQTPFYVVGEAGIPWQQEDRPLRAGVNGFGFGGTNCHVVLEQAPSLPATVTDSESAHLFLLTARNQKGLQTVARQLRSHLLDNPEPELAQVAFTFNNAQREFPDKTAFVVEDRQQLLDYLTAIANNTEADLNRGRANPQRPPKLSIFLDGSSLLAPEVTQILARQFPSFHKAYQDCQTAWFEYSWAKNATAKLTGKAHIFAANYALLSWLMSLKIQPTSLIAEDIGILVAACCSGRLTLEEALAALARLSGEKIVIPGKTSDEAKVNHNHWNCSLITPSGVFKQNITLSSIQASTLAQSAAGFDRDRLSSMTQTGVCLSLSNTRDGKEATSTWITPQIERSPVKDLLTLMAQLYVVGVPFDSSQLYPQGIRRVLLPTYPLEHKTYRAEIEVDSDRAVESVSNSSSTGLLPTQQIPSLSLEQRQASYLALKKVTKRLN